jgi:regulatory protein
MQRAAQFVAQQAGNARKSDLVPTAQIRSAYLATDPPCEIDADPPLAPAITDVAKAVVAQLRDAGYQSDARTAHSLVRHWSGRVSRSLLEHKLKTAGIAREESSTALSEEAVATTDFDTALALWNNKFRAPPEDEKTKARQVRFLQSRGFSPSTALRVLKAVGARTDESD